MKQTAVVFEAKIGSAGSAIDLNNMSCSDIMQGEKTRGRKDRGERDSGRVCSKVLRQGGCKRCLWREQVHFSCGGLHRQSYSWPWFPERELVSSEAPRRISC